MTTEDVAGTVNLGGSRSLPDLAVARIAARQHHLITHAQLRACGLSDRQIHGRLRGGRLFRVHVGVYAVGVPPTTDRARWMAAVLAVDGALSHGSAAALLGFATRTPARPHVTIARGRHRPRPGLVVHAVRALDVRDLTVVDAIPLTTGPRTLLDRAAQLGPRALDRELRQARALGLAPNDELRDVIARHPRRAGGPALAAALLGDFTRSELERRLLDLLGRHGLRRPRCNVLVEEIEVDCAWDDVRLVVELDGKATHGITAALARDAERDARLRAAGWRVLRLTWWDVVRDPRRTAAVLAEHLQR